MVEADLRRKRRQRRPRDRSLDGGMGRPHPRGQRSQDVPDILNQHKSHMQLFVLGYGESREKQDDPAAPSLAPSPHTRVQSLLSRSEGAEAAGEVAARGLWVADEATGGPEDSEDEEVLWEQQGVPTDEHPDAFASAMRLPLRVGQVFSVLPVDVMTGHWSRRRAAYSLLVCGGLSLLTILSAVDQFRKNGSLVDYMVVVFYFMSAITAFLFLRMARFWGGLLRAFRFQEQRHGACPGLRRTTATITLALLGVAFVEHDLSEMQIVIGLRVSYPNASTFPEYLEIYVNGNYPMVTMAIGYLPVLSPLYFYLNFVATFLWNFNDLFIMLLSVALATRFRFLKETVSNLVGDSFDLQAAGKKQRPLGKAYWRSVRLSYNSLSKLARHVDQALNSHLMVSFINNLYFICMQLLRGFDDPVNNAWYNTMYILFSFGFLVVRTAAVSVLAASVRDNSRSFKDTLYSVCAEDYDDEVYRFLVQVTSEEVALTGLNMFNVTRGLLLTVAGTILTYEVVLFQMGS